MRRLFIGAELPENLLAVLMDAQEALAEKARQIRVTPPQNLHLTLRFIGEVEEDRALALRRWLMGLHLPEKAAWQVRLKGYGSFPGREGLLVYGGLDCDPGLSAFVGELETGLRDLGLPPVQRPFLPHVTLARKAQLIGGLSGLDLPKTPASFCLPGLALFESRLGREGPRYQALVRYCTASGVWRSSPERSV